MPATRDPLPLALQAVVADLFGADTTWEELSPGCRDRTLLELVLRQRGLGGDVRALLRDGSEDALEAAQELAADKLNFIMTYGGREGRTRGGEQEGWGGGG